MAQISITIPDNQIQRIIDAVSAYYLYQATIGGVSNPETKAQFTKRMVVEYLKGIVLASEGQVAADAAKANAAASVEQISIS
jgi:hypothetical protein